jgi:hypothetical protein
MMTHRRLLLGLFLPGLIILLILIDPYSWYLNGSDARQIAPLHQLAVAIFGLLLQVLVVVAVARGSARTAASLAGAELLLAVSAVVFLFWRDGHRRFEWGIGSQDFAWLLAVAMVLRLALVAWLRGSVRREAQ